MPKKSLSKILDDLKVGILGSGHNTTYDTPTGYASTWVQDQPNIIDRALQGIRQKITPTPTPSPAAQYTTRPTASASPYVAPSPQGTAQPMQQYQQQPQVQPSVSPTPLSSFPLRKEIVQNYGENYPFKELIKKTWPGVDPNMVANVVFGESSFDPSLYHINGPGTRGHRPNTPQEWANIRSQFPSIDVGLTQVNTAKAMTEYLKKKGWTYYDLMNDPEKALAIGYDLYSGKIPGTAPGWQNWYATSALQEKQPEIGNLYKGR